MASYSVILTTIVLATLTFYLIWYIINRSKPSITDLVETQISISKMTQVLESNKVLPQLLAPPGSSVLGFFNLQLADKTVKLGNIYHPLIGIPGAWVFEIAPRPPRIGNNTTTARLRVYVSTSDGIKQETIELPDMPLQKWVFLSILRDGRRFDILYDDKIVVSHRLLHYPVIISNPLQVGNVGLAGYCTHVLISSSRLSSSIVSEYRSTLADTNGAPKANITSLVFPGLEIPDLTYTDIVPPTESPSDTMKRWTSPYA